MKFGCPGINFLALCRMERSRVLLLSMSGLFVHAPNPAYTNGEQGKKMFRGKNMIEIKMWWQRSETGNFFYHVVTMGALLSYFFLTAAFKSKGMHVGTGF